MVWAWLIPVLSFAAVPLIILFGKRLPGKGSPLAIIAVLAGFVVFWIVFAGFLSASPDTQGCEVGVGTEALTCNFQITWFEAGIPGRRYCQGGTHIHRLGHDHRPADGVDAGPGDLRRTDGPDLLPGLHARRPQAGLVLRFPRPVHSFHAHPGTGRQFPAALRCLGTGGLYVLTC